MTKSRLYDSRVGDHVVVHLGLNVNSSIHNCGWVVDGDITMAAIGELIIIIIICKHIIH